MENNFGYNRHKLVDYLKEEPKKKKESKPIEVGPVIVASIFFIVAIVMGLFFYSYLQDIKLEESPLKVGQIWKEEIIQQSIYTLQPETIVVKKEIIDLDYNTVYYHQVEPETTYTFYEADPYTFMCNSRKLR